MHFRCAKEITIACLILIVNNQKSEKVNTCMTSEQVLLATARVQIKSSNGEFETLTALIDSESQRTII